MVTTLYSLGAILSLTGLILSPRLLRRFGNYHLTLWAIFIEITALFALTSLTHPVAVGIAFVIHIAMPLLLSFGLDIFLERAIENEKHTGAIRSNYLTIINLGFVLSPLFIGKIISLTSLRAAYAFSAGFAIILLFVVIERFSGVHARKFREVNFTDSIRKFAGRKNLSTVYWIHFVLQCFFALMIIFTPLYLNTVIGFSWETIGAIFTFMLLPFILFEVPLGRYFDKIRGEKDALIIGFILISIACLTMFFLETKLAIVWAAVLFLSRTGASFVEIGTEYAFFRHVSDEDAGFISVYRTTQPVSFLIAPLVAGIVLSTGVGINYVFLVIGLIVPIGAALAYKLKR